MATNGTSGSGEHGTPRPDSPTLGGPHSPPGNPAREEPQRSYTRHHFGNHAQVPVRGGPIRPNHHRGEEGDHSLGVQSSSRRARLALKKMMESPNLSDEEVDNKRDQRER